MPDIVERILDVCRHFVLRQVPAQKSLNDRRYCVGLLLSVGPSLGGIGVGGGVWPCCKCLSFSRLHTSLAGL